MSLDLGKSGSYMRSISIGKALPSMHEFLRICEYLGVTPQEFFTGAGDETDRINIFNRLQDLDDGDIQKLQTFLGWIHPHMFRHTFVSLLMSNPDIGVATVAAEAGHAQPSTTLMIYTQQYKKRRESIRNQLSRELYEK